MPVLDQLTFSTVTPKRDMSPLGRFRRRMIEAIDLQLAMAEADAAGSEMTRIRKRRIKNDAGVKELREVPVRLRRWWWKDDAGTTYLSLRNAGRPLEIAPGRSAIEVGAVTELPDKLAILRDAVRAGELDGCMVETTPRGRKKKGGKEEEKPSPAPSARKAPRKPEEGARPAGS